MILFFLGIFVRLQQLLWGVCWSVCGKKPQKVVVCHLSGPYKKPREF